MQKQSKEQIIEFIKFKTHLPVMYSDATQDVILYQKNCILTEEGKLDVLRQESKVTKIDIPTTYEAPQLKYYFWGVNYTSQEERLKGFVYIKGEVDKLVYIYYDTATWVNISIAHHKHKVVALFDHYAVVYYWCDSPLPLPNNQDGDYLLVDLYTAKKYFITNDGGTEASISLYKTGDCKIVSIGYTKTAGWYFILKKTPVESSKEIQPPGGFPPRIYNFLAVAYVGDIIAGAPLYRYIQNLYDLGSNEGIWAIGDSLFKNVLETNANTKLSNKKLLIAIDAATGGYYYITAYCQKAYELTAGGDYVEVPPDTGEKAILRMKFDSAGNLIEFTKLSAGIFGKLPYMMQYLTSYVFYECNSKNIDWYYYALSTDKMGAPGSSLLLFVNNPWLMDKTYYAELLLETEWVDDPHPVFVHLLCYSTEQYVYFGETKFLNSDGLFVNKCIFPFINEKDSWITVGHDLYPFTFLHKKIEHYPASIPTTFAWECDPSILYDFVNYVDIPVGEIKNVFVYDDNFTFLFTSRFMLLVDARYTQYGEVSYIHFFEENADEILLAKHGHYCVVIRKITQAHGEGYVIYYNPETTYFVIRPIRITGFNVAQTTDQTTPGQNDITFDKIYFQFYGGDGYGYSDPVTYNNVVVGSDNGNIFEFDIENQNGFVYIYGLSNGLWYNIYGTSSVADELGIYRTPVTEGQIKLESWKLMDTSQTAILIGNVLSRVNELFGKCDSITSYDNRLLVSVGSDIYYSEAGNIFLWSVDLYHFSFSTNNIKVFTSYPVTRRQIATTSALMAITTAGECYQLVGTLPSYYSYGNFEARKMGNLPSDYIPETVKLYNDLIFFMTKSGKIYVFDNFEFKEIFFIKKVFDDTKFPPEQQIPTKAVDYYLDLSNKVYASMGSIRGTPCIFFHNNPINILLVLDLVTLRTFYLGFSTTNDDIIKSKNGYIITRKGQNQLILSDGNIYVFDSRTELSGGVLEDVGLPPFVVLGFSTYPFVSSIQKIILRYDGDINKVAFKIHICSIELEYTSRTPPTINTSFCKTFDTYTLNSQNIISPGVSGHTFGLFLEGYGTHMNFVDGIWVYYQPRYLYKKTQGV